MNSWVGIRAISVDSNPIVGQERYDNFFVLTGFSGSGIQLSPICAKMLANFILKDEISNDLKPYLPNRF